MWDNGTPNGILPFANCLTATSYCFTGVNLSSVFSLGLQIMCEQHISFGIPFKPTKNYTCHIHQPFFFRVSIQKSPSFFSPVRGVWRCSPATKNSRPRILHHSELLSPELASWVWWNPMCRMRPSLTIFGEIVLRELVRWFFMVVIHPKLDK